MTLAVARTLPPIQGKTPRNSEDSAAERVAVHGCGRKTRRENKKSGLTRLRDGTKESGKTSE
jgi:hypothetical protein